LVTTVDKVEHWSRVDFFAALDDAEEEWLEACAVALPAHRAGSFR
jgi:hypothetical protein